MKTNLGFQDNVCNIFVKRKFWFCNKLCYIHLFQLTLSDRKRKAYKTRPIGSRMGIHLNFEYTLNLLWHDQTARRIARKLKFTLCFCRKELCENSDKINTGKDRPIFGNYENLSLTLSLTLSATFKTEENILNSILQNYQKQTVPHESTAQ